MTDREARKSGLTTRDLHALDLVCQFVDRAFPHRTYLVGTAGTQPEYRDVDVRTIVDDDEFDRVFGASPGLWEVYCFTVGCWLTQQTGLPVDYQVQRMTEANAKHDGPRNPLGFMACKFAGLGDATAWLPQPTTEGRTP